ncbi:pyruvate kinase [Patescibacteria group bacterium]|nr:pyruvate kinase [Patescibacteria group bacterium]MCL5091787.1 pyruvate kinase [Patescibacteria group bacterium]
MKLTKIVATIGPASDSEEMIAKLIEQGVNVFRFNFKHNTKTWHDQRIKLVKKVSHRLGVPVGTLIDLQGPEIRVRLDRDQIAVHRGQKIEFGTPAFTVSHPQILPQLKTGQIFLADDGYLHFTLHRKGNALWLESHHKGILKNNKSFNIPDTHLDLPILSARDFDGIELANNNEMSFIALSFVRSAKDIEALRREMRKRHLQSRIIAKIENSRAIANLDKIIAASDGVMVARGDLGVELPMEQVPYYQKIIIAKTVAVGKPVITATQMLQTMVDQAQPTRAEVSDVANATYDLSDAVMLSGETAAGRHPLAAVQTMAKTVSYNECRFSHDTRRRFAYRLDSLADTICEAAYDLYLSLQKRSVKIAGFLVFTHSGQTAATVARYRPVVPVYGFVPNLQISQRLSLHFGVMPFIQTRALVKAEVTRKEVQDAVQILLNKQLIKKGDALIVVHGDYWTVKGGTSTVKLLVV